MDEPITYDSDFFAWSQQQALVLRELAKSHRLPNEFDVEHVAEEIEDVGRAELNSVQSYLRQIFVHLIKAASAPDAEAVGHWHMEVVTFHNELLGRFTPSMARRIDQDTLWQRARKEAEVALAQQGDEVAPDLPASCPFTILELTTEAFSFEAALETLKSFSASPQVPAER